MSTSVFPDIKIEAKDRQLSVVTEWSQQRNAWYVSIRDDSRSKRLKSMTVGSWIIEETAQWCYNQGEVIKARAAAERDARSGRLR